MCAGAGQAEPTVESEFSAFWLCFSGRCGSRAKSKDGALEAVEHEIVSVLVPPVCVVGTARD